MMLVSKVSRKQIKNTLRCEEVLALSSSLLDLVRLGELTRDSKYIDRHDERLRRANGLDLWNRMRRVFLLDE